MGVAGAGVFGGFHAQKIKADNRAAFIGIFDQSIERANALAEANGGKGFDNIDEFLSNIDALIVATPATTHGNVACAALAAGKHCLIEKPLAANPEVARKLCETAEQKNLILQAGHQERYIFKAMGLLDRNERPKVFEAARIGLPSQRGADVSATFDLMVHDLDLALILFRTDPVKIKAKCHSGSPENPDDVEAEIIFSCGGVAKFRASRASDERRRTTVIKYASGELSIDYISREFKDETGFKLHKEFAERIKDPMQQATSDFISSIIDGTPISIPARDGERAVILAQKIDDASRQ